MSTFEPLSASKYFNYRLLFKFILILGPFSYLSCAMIGGVSIWYFDYWRRRALEEVLYSEERRRYHSKYYKIFLLLK